MKMSGIWTLLEESIFFLFEFCIGFWIWKYLISGRSSRNRFSSVRVSTYLNPAVCFEYENIGCLDALRGIDFFPSCVFESCSVCWIWKYKGGLWYVGLGNQNFWWGSYVDIFWGIDFSSIFCIIKLYVDYYYLLFRRMLEFWVLFWTW